MSKVISVICISFNRIMTSRPKYRMRNQDIEIFFRSCRQIAPTASAHDESPFVSKPCIYIMITISCEKTIFSIGMTETAARSVIPRSQSVISHWQAAFQREIRSKRARYLPIPQAARNVTTYQMTLEQTISTSRLR